MVFKAMTVVDAMPPKLKLQSLICHEPAFRSFSSNTLMPVFTMAISSSRLRACLKAKTYSCCKNKHYLITLLKGQYIIFLDYLSIIYQSGHRTQFVYLCLPLFTFLVNGTKISIKTSLGSKIVFLYPVKKFSSIVTFLVFPTIGQKNYNI